MHLKRQRAPKSWPIYKKGTAYVVNPRSDLQKGIPVLIVLRDILKIAMNRNEVKKALHMGNILIDDKIVRDEKKSMTLFDVLTVIPAKKHYRLELNMKGKFEMAEVKESEINYKIAKIIDRKTLKGKRVQINLSDGRNFFSDLNCKINDSALINFKDKKIEKCLPLQEKSKVVVFAGKHTGKKGVVEKINAEKKMAELKVDKENINALIKQLIVVN